MKTFLIQPSMEPNGEGNGWEDCAEEKATHWFVYNDADEVSETFESRAAAEKWVDRFDRGTFILAFYELGLGYGGAEEGGWWFSTGDLTRVFKIMKSRKAARIAANRAERLLNRLQRHKREVSSVIYSGGRHCVQVYEDTAPRHFPEQRPYFE